MAFRDCLWWLLLRQQICGATHSSQSREDGSWGELAGKVEEVTVEQSACPLIMCHGQGARNSLGQEDSYSLITLLYNSLPYPPSPRTVHHDLGYITGIVEGVGRRSPVRAESFLWGTVLWEDLYD